MLNMAIAFTKTAQPEEAIRLYRRALESRSARSAARTTASRSCCSSGGRQDAAVAAPAGVPGAPAPRAPTPSAGCSTPRRRCAGWRRDGAAAGVAVTGLPAHGARASGSSCSNLDELADGVIALEVRAPAPAQSSSSATPSLRRDPARSQDGDSVRRRRGVAHPRRLIDHDRRHGRGARRGQPYTR